jgi:hypothetical protein
MRPKLLLLCTALLLPMTLLSCDDSTTPTDVSVDDAEPADLPSLTTVGFGSRYHDPHISGATVLCFSGNEDDPITYNGDCKRFKSKDGVEVNTIDDDELPSNAYAGFYGKKNIIAGKLVGKVKELDFAYAGGGPSGGSPRFSIPIDACKVADDYVGTVEYPPCTTDGHWDFFIFADVTESSGCNDGDGFVGILNGEDDETCTWYLDGTIPYANWAAFVAAHPNWRIATDTPPFAIVDQPGHYLLFKWDVR